MSFSKSATEFFLSRGIEPETAAHYGICTTDRSDIGEAIAFPYVREGETVSSKYRGRGKKFSQDKGGGKYLWNSDVLDDPALADGEAKLIVCEGEVDALSFIEAGFPHVVSVPGGAPTQAMGEKGIEEGSYYQYLWNDKDRLNTVQEVIIASDGDGPGRALAEDLITFFGPVRCWLVDYPDGTKDASDVLIKHGKQGISELINGAKQVPLNGIYTLDQYPEFRVPETYSTGFSGLDQYMKVYEGAFIPVTGVPSHGKSTWIAQTVMNLCESNNWKAAIGSFESRPVPHFRNRLRQYRINKPWDKQSAEEQKEADYWIRNHILFIDHAPEFDRTEDHPDIMWFLNKAADAVMRYGVKVILLDPWNEVEHQRRRGESETEYTGRAIRAMKAFAQQFNVILFVVVHPAKPSAEERNERPTLYRISGSAHWYNKADIGVVVWRPEDGEAEVHVEKVREPFAGSKGMIEYSFDKDTTKYHRIA